MSDPIATASFDGIPPENVVGCAFTFNAHGILPSVCALDILPQPALNVLNGTLRISYGQTQIAWPDCRIDAHQLERNDEGQIYRVWIWDRRWRWQFGQISGEYNRQQDDAERLLTQGKTPQQLAELCLAAMLEPLYDVSDLPNVARPHVLWDLENPAQALAELCESLACRVVLGLDNVTRIKRAGIGQQPPVNDALIDSSAGINAAELPDRIVVATAPLRYQLDLPLEAIAQDVNGEWLPVDNVSYRPANGFADLIHFTDVAEASGMGAAELAARTVYRVFRPIFPIQTTLYGEIADRERVTLLPEMAETTWDVEQKKYVRAPALVYGEYTHPLEIDARQTALAYLDSPLNTVQTEVDLLAVSGELDETDQKAVVDIPFAVDQERGQIRLGAAVTLLTDNALTAPNLALRCACLVKDEHTGAVERFAWPRRLTNAPAGATRDAMLPRDDIEPVYIEGYASDLTPSGIIFQNDANTIAKANHYLDEAARAITAAQDSVTARYVGIHDVTLDGARMQVTYALGNRRPATTTIGYNDEQIDAAPSFKERRFREKLARLVKQPAGVAP